ncbi:MAG: hypothetical protein GC192_17145 [Bacteroidetes bacterium]|nr:hypothetical protein [Bacteroidota bacterium]
MKLLALFFCFFALPLLAQQSQFDATIEQIALLEKALGTEKDPHQNVVRQQEIIRLYGQAIQYSEEATKWAIRWKSRYALGSLSWYFLLDNNPVEAQATAEQALKSGGDFNMEWVNSNLAPALLLQGKWEESKAVYVSHKDQAYPDGTDRNWTQVFLQDLDALEAAGITHPDMARARKLLKE